MGTVTSLQYTNHSISYFFHAEFKTVLTQLGLSPRSTPTQFQNQLGSLWFSAPHIAKCSAADMPSSAQPQGTQPCCFLLTFQEEHLGLWRFFPQSQIRTYRFFISRLWHYLHLSLNGFSESFFKFLSFFFSVSSASSPFCSHLHKLLTICNYIIHFPRKGQHFATLAYRIYKISLKKKKFS